VTRRSPDSAICRLKGMRLMDQPPVDIVDRHRTAYPCLAPEYCDTCAGTGALVEAFVFAELPSGLSLAYCAHHGTSYLERLREIALVVIDHRHLVLLREPSYDASDSIPAISSRTDSRPA